VITFLVHLYQSTGIIAASKYTSEEEGYTKLDRDGAPAEVYELTEQDLGDSDEDVVKVGAEDEDDWADPNRREMKGVRL
jgi:hypothetical protein